MYPGANREGALDHYWFERDRGAHTRRRVRDVRHLYLSHNSAKLTPRLNEDTISEVN